MVAHPLPRRAAVARLLDVLVTPVVFLASIPIAYTYGATAARYTWALLIVLSPISGALASRRIARVLAEESRTPERS